MEPQRTCIGCRACAGKRQLVRLAWVSEVGVVIDSDQQLPGRGAYLHRHCSASAQRRGAVARALRRSADPKQVATVLAGLAG